MSLPESFFIPGQGLVLDGHATGLAGPRAGARDWLAAHGADAFTAEDVTEQARVVRAWYSDDLGFVGEEHPDGRPVTVVHIPEGVV